MDKFQGKSSSRPKRISQRPMSPSGYECPKCLRGYQLLFRYKLHLIQCCPPDLVPEDLPLTATEEREGYSILSPEFARKFQENKLVFPSKKKMMFGSSPRSTPDQGTVLDSKSQAREILEVLENLHVEEIITEGCGGGKVFAAEDELFQATSKLSSTSPNPKRNTLEKQECSSTVSLPSGSETSASVVKELQSTYTNDHSYVNLNKDELSQRKEIFGHALREFPPMNFLRKPDKSANRLDMDTDVSSSEISTPIKLATKTSLSVSDDTDELIITNSPDILQNEVMRHESGVEVGTCRMTLPEAEGLSRDKLECESFFWQVFDAPTFLDSNDIHIPEPNQTSGQQQRDMRCRGSDLALAHSRGNILPFTLPLVSFPAVYHDETPEENLAYIMVNVELKQPGGMFYDRRDELLERLSKHIVNKELLYCPPATTNTVVPKRSSQSFKIPSVPAHLTTPSRKLTKGKPLNRVLLSSNSHRPMIKNKGKPQHLSAYRNLLVSSDVSQRRKMHAGPYQYCVSAVKTPSSLCFSRNCSSDFEMDRRIMNLKSLTSQEKGNHSEKVLLQSRNVSSTSTLKEIVATNTDSKVFPYDRLNRNPVPPKQSQDFATVDSTVEIAPDVPGDGKCSEGPPSPIFADEE